MGRLIIPPGARVYLDANIVIHFIEGFPANQLQIDELLARIESGNVKAMTSELTLAEVLVKPFTDDNVALINVYEALFAGGTQLEVLPVSRTVLRQAALHRAATRNKLPDAIHIATAIEASCPFILSEDSRLRMPAILEHVRLADLSL